MRRTRLSAISIVMLASLLPAQTFRHNSNIVLVQVSVTDRHNHPVLGLEQDRFEVVQDHITQPLAFFGRDDAPLSVGMVLDVSGSIGAALGKVRDALAQFCGAANPADEFFLVTVSTTAELLEPFTNHCGDLRGKLFNIPAGGNTSLFDGVAMGLHQLKKARNSRRALVVVTDGDDNHSRYTRRELMNLAVESDAQIYVLGLPANIPAAFMPEGPDGGSYFEEPRQRYRRKILRRLRQRADSRSRENDRRRIAQSICTGLPGIRSSARRQVSPHRGETHRASWEPEALRDLQNRLLRPAAVTYCREASARAVRTSRSACRAVAAVAVKCPILRPGRGSDFP